MKKTIQLYNNLYGESGGLPLPDFVHCETIESRSKAYNWEIKPHVHTQLYQVFLMATGGGFLILEQGEIPFQTPCIIAIPANHLHGFRYSEPTDGRVLTLSDAYLEKLFKAAPKVNLVLNEIQVLPIESIYKPKFDYLIELIDRVGHELHEDLAEKQLSLQANLSLLFVEIFRFNQTKQPETQHPTRNTQHILRGGDARLLQYFQDFQRSIRKSLSAAKPISEFAKELNISPIYLNRVCQTIAQKTASEIIVNQLVTEAKKYLTHTSYSISEISYMLDFSEPAYFSRVFKKQTGQSPKEFRAAQLMH